MAIKQLYSSAKGILLQAYLKSETKSNQAFLWGQILFISVDCWEVQFEIMLLVFILFLLTVNVEFFNEKKNFVF
jgi:ABC-type Mn2+/Zn2+ transport system permease subunit